jgi:methylated-DNA-[protein]-cysteine S-methyltransferase
VYRSPIGEIVLRTNDRGLTRLDFVKEPGKIPSGTEAKGNEHLKTTVSQLEEYFAGMRTCFDLSLDMNGTPFQVSVWRALLLIPCGTTCSYGDIASRIGRPKAVRAVGGANHNNPISIIVPCHRVIGGDGKLTGYGGGLWRKEWLLGHEKKMTDKTRSVTKHA